jgi:tellurite resistance protein
MVKEQYCILEADEDKALAALAKLIPGEHDRDEALGLSRRIALADGSYTREEADMIEKIGRGLGIAQVETENKLLKFRSEKRM